MEIHALGSSHQQALSRFFRDLVAGGDEQWFHPHPLTDETAREICHYDGQDVYLIGVEDGRILAYGMLRGWDEGYETPSLGIAVAGDVRGGGIATAMMEALRGAAQERGASRIRLKVHHDNVAALRLYNRLGYRVSDALGDELVAYLELGA